MASRSTAGQEFREPGVCRCCLAAGTFKSMEEVYSWRGHPENYCLMLLEAFNMTFLRTETDTARLLICGLCVCRLRDACGFRRQLHESQESFQRLVNSDQFKFKSSNDVKVECKEELVEVEVKLEEYHEDGEDADDFTPSDFEDDDPLNTIPQAKPKITTPPVDATSSTLPVAGRGPRNNRTRSVATLKRKRGPAATSKRKATLPLNSEILIELKVPEGPAGNLGPSGSEGTRSVATLKRKRGPAATSKRKAMVLAEPKVPEGPAGNLAASGSKGKRSGATLKRKRRPAAPSKRKGMALPLNSDIVSEPKVPGGPAGNLASSGSEGKESKPNPNSETASGQRSEIFMTPKLMRANPKKAHNTLQYKCNDCALSFCNWRAKRTHMQTVHDVAWSERTVFKCRWCREPFNSIQKRKEHIETAHPSQLACPKCPETFRTRYYRWKHLRDVHGEETRFPCGVCAQSYADSQGLVKHQRRVHMMERNYACAQCGRGFFTRHQMNNHMAGHGTVRAHECDICGKRFARRNTMLYHRRIHTGDRRSVCRLCGQAFVQSASLKYHMGRHHPDE